MKGPFLCALVPQLLLCIAYWCFGVDQGGGGTPFGEAVMLFYLPAAYITMIPALLVGGWAGIGFLQIASPLVGALLYSVFIAWLVRGVREGWFTAFFSLFRSGA